MKTEFYCPSVKKSLIILKTFLYNNVLENRFIFTGHGEKQVLIFLSFIISTQKSKLVHPAACIPTSNTDQLLLIMKL